MATAQSDSLRVEAIADQLPVGIWVARVPSGELLYANPAFTEIMGIEARDDVVVGGYSGPYGIYRRGGGLYPEDELPFVQALRRGGRVTLDDIEILRRDGSRVPVRATAQPVRGSNGEFTHVVIGFVDITSQIAAQQGQRRAEDHLRRVVSSAPLLFWATDPQGIITLSEGCGLTALGFQPGELVGQSVFDLYAGMPHVLDIHHRCMRGESFHGVVQVGKTFMDSRVTPLRGPEGQLLGSVGVALDVTDRQQMQRQLVHADRMAAVGTLAAGVAHEINNPLTYICGTLDLLERELSGTGGSGRAQELLRQAKEGLDRVGRIVKDLRTFARPSADPARAVDLRVPLRAALRLCEQQVRHKAELIEDYCQLPEVSGVESKLAQVFLNLFINAAQAIPAGRAKANRITVRGRRGAAGEAVVEISDTGEGIPPEDLDRLFDPFFTTKSEEHGTGLGLSVSRSIIESHGGTIEVESTVGAGSTFRVRLPAADLGRVSPARSEAAKAGPAACAQRGRVLLIDDDKNLLRVFQLALGPEHEVRACSSAEEGLRALSCEDAYDLVLCDVMLADLPVQELYARARAQRPGIERLFVFMTGGAYTAAARTFLETVPNERLHKPFDVRVAVTTALSSRR